MTYQNDLETIRQQCRSFVFSGVYCQIKEPVFQDTWVLLTINCKTYRFSDPDLNVIISQLAHIYIKLKHKVADELH